VGLSRNVEGYFSAEVVNLLTALRNEAMNKHEDDSHLPLIADSHFVSEVNQKLSQF